MKKNVIFSKNHQERFGVEKNVKNPRSVEVLGDVGSVDEIKHSPSLQEELYETGDVSLMKLFFTQGGCFGQKVQRRITVDNNLEVLSVFLAFWEFIPTERSYMIKNASLEFIEHYMAVRKLGKQGEEFAGNGRFSREFVARHAHLLNDKAKNICRGFRKIEVE